MISSVEHAGVLPIHQDGAAEIGDTDQTKDASDEASVKPWKCELCLLVFSPKCPKFSEDLQMGAEGLPNPVRQ